MTALFSGEARADCLALAQKVAANSRTITYSCCEASASLRFLWKGVDGAEVRKEFKGPREAGTEQTFALRLRPSSQGEITLQLLDSHGEVSESKALHVEPLTPPPPAPTEAPIASPNRISLGTGGMVFSESALDTTNGSTGNISSNLGQYVELALSRNWTPTFQTTLLGSWSRASMQAPAGRKIENGPVDRLAFALTGEWSAAPWFWGFRAQRGSQLFFRSLTLIRIQVDTLNSTSFGPRIGLRFPLSPRVKLALEGNGGAILPIQDSFYTSRTGYYWSAGTSLEYEAGRVSLLPSIRYEQRHINVSDLKFTDAAAVFGLAAGWRFGGP